MLYAITAKGSIDFQVQDILVNLNCFLFNNLVIPTTQVRSMINKGVVFGCHSGYSTTNEKMSAFEFLFKDPELLEKWIKLGNRRDWKPTKNCNIH